MPTSQKVQIDTYDFGASLTNPTLGALTTGTTITNGTANSCNEQTADSGVYIADFVGADASALIPAGTYRLRTTVNGKPLKRFVTFSGVDGELVYARSERAVELDSATQAQLDVIENSVDTYIAGISAVASTTTGTIVGFPSSLNAGDSYTDEANASIHVFIRDASDDPITAVGDFNFTDPEFAPEVNITQSGSTGRVKAVVTFVEASPEDYLKVEIPSSQSRRASPGTATIQCLLKWVDTDGKVLCQKTLSKQAVTWNEMV